VAELEAHGVKVDGVELDVTDHPALAAAVTRARDTLGPLGGLVHSAGISGAQPIDAIEWPVWDNVIAIHLSAYAHLAELLVPHLVEQAGGALVGISSINGLIGNGANPAYCAAKAGVLGLTRSLAHGLGPRGIRVNAICPGYVETPMTAPSRRNAATNQTW